MPTPVLAVPLAVAIVLIVVGRVRHGARWGDWVAVTGYGLLAVTIIVGVLTR